MNLNLKKSICSVNDIKNNEIKSFWIDDKEVIITKHKNQFYSFLNNCPHQNSDILQHGFIENNCLVCPNHLFNFDLQTGLHKASKLKLTKIPLKILNDNIYLADDVNL